MSLQCYESTASLFPPFSPLFSPLSAVGSCSFVSIIVSKRARIHSIVFVTSWNCITTDRRELLVVYNLLKLQNNIEAMVKIICLYKHKGMGLGANLFAILIYSSSEKIIQSARFNERLQFNQEVLLRSYNINGYCTSWLSYSLDNSVLCCYLWG